LKPWRKVPPASFETAWKTILATKWGAAKGKAQRDEGTPWRKMLFGSLETPKKHHVANRQFRTAIETPFGKRRGQENAKGGSCRSLGNRHGQERGKRGVQR